MPHDLIIVGGGPAGVTAGIYAARQKLKILLITKDFGGQIAKKAVDIENYPGFEKISGSELIKRFVEHLKKQEIEIKITEVREVEKRGEYFYVQTTDKEKYSAKAVIVATGADPRPLEVPGEKEFIGKGVSYCVTCLPSGEEVVADNSLKQIGEIGIAQKILTVDGNFQNISQIVSRDYCGKMIKIKTKFFTEPVKLTSNHPVLTATIKKNSRRKIQIIGIPKWKKAGELTLEDAVLYPIISRVKDVEKIRFSRILGVEVKNGKVKNNQETYTSRRLADEIPVNEKFLRLAGYYLAEGSIGKQHLNFDFYYQEKEYIEDVKKLVRELFALKVYEKKRDGVIRLTVSSKLLRDLFYLLFGKNAPNKKIPQWMLFLPQYKQKEIIKALYRGDGCSKAKDFTIVTTSKILAYQLRDILLRFKIIPGIDRREKEKLNKVPGDIGGRKIRFNYDKYDIRIGGPSLEKMSEILGIRHPLLDKRKRTFRYAWIKSNYLYLPIREITKEKYKGRVYNLVTEKNTYVTKNFIVHNCDGPVFKSKTVAVVGGGNAGFEAAIFMTNYAKKIYILEYGSEVRADKINQEIVQKSGKVEVLTNVAVKEIQGKNFVESIVYQDLATKETKTLKVDGIFVEIGYQPATAFVKGLVDFNERDEIKVEFETCQTKTPGLFAVGDVNVGTFKQIITACGEGCKAALAAYSYISNLKFEK